MQFEQFDLDMAIQRMQDAVDVVLSSEHDTSKVSACLFDPAGEPAAIIARANHRPPALKARFEWQERIGKSSQFIHAETACLLEYGRSAKGHSICITDPFCPNCAKTLAVSGVARIFIDHKGMDKDFVQRRSGAFNLISLEIAQRAGIDVYILYRKEKRFEPLRLARMPQKPPFPGFTAAPAGEALSDMAARDVQAALKQAAAEAGLNAMAQSAALCLAQGTDGQVRLVQACESLPPGLAPQDVAHIHPEDTDKYRFPVDALNNLYFTLTREGLRPLGGVVYCNRVPSSRAFVNMLLTDIRTVMIHGLAPDHDATGLEAAHLYARIGLADIVWL